MNAKDLLPPKIEFQEDTDPHLRAVADFEEAARQLDLEDWIVNRLRHMEREVAVNLPLVREGGRPVSVTGYRVQHISSGQPTVGTVRISPAACVSELRADAMQATWQSELLNLPFGGAAGAIVCNPDELSEWELRAVAKDYVQSLRGIVGRDIDVLIPGPGCNEQTMAWMLDGYSKIHGLDFGAVTGKPSSVWGLPANAELLAHGVSKVMQHVCRKRNRTLAGQSVSMQGFSDPASFIARALFNAGARIVAVADISGGLYNERGIEIPALQKHVQENGVIYGFPEADSACNADIVEADCDMLVTAAAERQITVANAPRVKAGVVVEAVRRAVTPAAEAVLAAAGRPVIPDMLSTCAQLVLAFVEWNQSVTFLSSSFAEVSNEVDTRLKRACDSIFDYAAHNAVTPRRAATVIAADRIARKLRVRN